MWVKGLVSTLKVLLTNVRFILIFFQVPERHASWPLMRLVETVNHHPVETEVDVPQNIQAIAEKITSSPAVCTFTLINIVFYCNFFTLISLVPISYNTKFQELNMARYFLSWFVPVVYMCHSSPRNLVSLSSAVILAFASSLFQSRFYGSF